MLTFRQLDSADLPALMELQETVRQNLSDPHMFECEEESRLEFAITGSGAVFGAFDGVRLAGYGIVTFPGVHSENLCYDVPHLRIDPTEVAHLDGSAVHPAYRGLAIQQRLSVLRIADAARKGARHLLLTISPMNPHSLRNHLNGGGFLVSALKLKYGGKWRLILYRALDGEEPTAVGPRESCALDDIGSHQQLLAAGFCGIRLVGREGLWQVAYEKLLL